MRMIWCSDNLGGMSRICWIGHHVYNTTKTVCKLVNPKETQRRFSTRVILGNEELSFVEEFRYLGHIMTADCRDDKDIKKTIQEAKCSWQYAGQEIFISTY